MAAETTNNNANRSRPVVYLTAALVLINLAFAAVFLIRSPKKVLRIPAEATGKADASKADRAAYAGSGSCRECHKEAYAQWETSHHAQAERAFDAVRDRAAFDPPQQFKHGTQVTDARISGNARCEVVTMSRSGDRQVFLPERVIGVEPLRQYMVGAPGGRYQVTEVAWDPRSNQWFNVYGEEDRQPGEWGHWTGRGMNWNMMCAYCHNTGVQKGYDAKTDSYATTMVEGGVGCEACHGPMAAHVKWQRPRPQPAQGDPTIRRLTKDQMRDVCGACHARRSELTGFHPPGDDFFDHYALVIPDESDVYYPDGQIRDEDYEFAAFLGSRMHFSEVRCKDCHQPHTAKTRQAPDALCMQCHGAPIPPAPKIDAATHSHHKRAQPGDHCVDCHMPQTIYMARHWRRDHGFTIPDPLVTKEHGIPNACTRCHADKTVDWSIEAVNQWYGKRMERPTRRRAQMLAKAHKGDASAWPELVRLSRDEPIPYWRAVALLMLRPWHQETNVLAAMIERTRDSSPLVRAMSARALDGPAGTGHPAVLSGLEPLLSDAARMVRVEAAWALRRTAPTNSRAGEELLHVMTWNSDQPHGLMQRAVWNMDRGDNAEAIALLQKAVTWDRYSAPLFNALAVSLSMAGRHQEALERMETACQLAPRDADCRFRLALALNELNRVADATKALEETVKLDAGFSRAWYNLGLAYSGQGKAASALEALAKAEKLEPRSGAVPYARATILIREGRTVEARAALLRVMELEPANAEARALLNQLRESP